MSENHFHEKAHHQPPKAPLWKWVVVIFLIVAMPLFFAFVRSNQMQRALNNTAPETVNTPVGPAAQDH